MPEIALGLSAKKRQTLWTPKIRVLNLLAEQSVTNQLTGLDHIARPGEVLFSEVGTGPIRGVYRQAGTFLGDFLTVSGDQWFRVDVNGDETLLGAVPGDLRTVTAATGLRAITVSDGIAYSTNGTTVVVVNMPDGRLVGSVAQLNGYFILTELNSARFYWIEPGQVDPDGLSFATTESTPGYTQKCERVGDELWFLKSEGTEVWAPTGDADLPFQRIPGRNYDKGCRNGDTVTRFDNSVAWVGNDAIIYRGDNSPLRISDNSVEEWVRKSQLDTLRSWSFTNDGHTLLIVTSDLGTRVYDVLSQQWSDFATYGQEHWRCHLGDAGEDFVVAGDDASNRLYRLDSEVTNDAGLPLVRTLTGGLTVVGAPQRCDNFQLYATTGTIRDPNLIPKARVSWSDDMETYGDFVDVELKRQGNYGQPIRINRLGQMRYPGRLFEITVTDDCVVTISGASYNTPSR